MEVKALRDMTIDELLELAARLEVRNSKQAGKDDLLRNLMAHLAKANELHYTNGILEVHPDGYGFLRGEGCLPDRTDIYV